MCINVPNCIKQRQPSKFDILKELKQCVKGHIEVTESESAYHFYISINDYCCKIFFNYTLVKDELNLQSAFGITNKILNNYKHWLLEKNFY